MKICSLLVGLIVWSYSCEALTGSSKPAAVGIVDAKFGIQRKSQDIYVESSNILSDKDYSEQKVSVSSSTRRALRLFEILSKEVVTPVGLALTKDGVPTDWDDFWNTPCDSQSDATLASRAALALEQMGPTYVKFGQALASRPDIVPRSLATALSTLQDQMQPFDTSLAKAIVRRELSSKSLSAKELEDFVSSLSASPVAAASIGQVYSGTLPNNQKVAIKVQRPGIRETVEEDTELLRTIVRLVESIPAIPRLQKGQDRLISTDLSGAVEEFMSRIFEELDYRNEANNIDLFSSLYSHRRKIDSKSSHIQVVVPHPYMDLCTDNVLVMEWIDGTKLVDLQSEDSTRDSLVLIEQVIECTLSQLLDTGVMHADPHQGNLWKVLEVTEQGNTIQRFGYVDFGLLSSVPINVRDGLVCAVAELVFSRNVTAVANLFGELDLIPEEVLSDPSERAALSKSLNEALSEVLQYNTQDGSSTTTTTIPTLRFDKLLDALARLVPRFQFRLPPYFLNNARALATLEGMAREIDPSFNVLQVMYPYTLERLLSNPNKSPVVEATLQSLIRSPVTGRVDKRRFQKLLDDSTTLTGFSRAKVIRDILSSKSGPRLARIILQEQIRQVLGRGRFTKMANYLRL